jgi:hypothetical protein
MQADTIECRLCGGTSKSRFSRRALDDSEVSYYECTLCLSLQTEEPYWLKELYADAQEAARRPGSEEENPDLDTWAVERTLYCRMVIYFLWKLGGITKSEDRLLDWGGGPGLLTRMLRDVGIQAYNYDRYVRNHFASGFGRSDGDRYDFVTAFEVFEHFAKPKSDAEVIFSLQPSALLISTEIYKDQGPDWPYLGPAKSAHVFFYSDEALRRIGSIFDYKVVRLDRSMALFTRTPVAKARLMLIQKILSRRRLAEILFALKHKYSLSGEDNQKIRQRLLL